MTSPPRYLTTDEAAAYARVSKSTLEKARCTGDGPPYFKPSKTVLYLIEDIDDWVRSRRFHSTSEYDTGRSPVAA